MFKTIFIDDILESPPTNSGLKKKHVLLEKNQPESIPVYSASQDENLIFGWLNKDTKWKTYENILTWNKDGSAGHVFYRKGKFIPYEKVKLLKVKKEFEPCLDYEYLKYAIETKLLAYGFDFNFKCSMERVLKIQISIPTDKNGNFDLKEQKRLAGKYKNIYYLKNELASLYEEIKALDIDISFDYPTKELSIAQIFAPIKGNAKYTKKYMRNHKGNYPVYSSQTLNNGIIGKIDSFDYDTECLTWTTDGIYAGTIFYRNEKFSMTTHCGALFLKDMYKNEIDLKYVLYQLSLHLKNYATGEGNKRLTVKMIQKVPVKIVVNKNGAFDIKKQKEIADKYLKIDKIKSLLRKDFSEVVNKAVNINLT
ncbi:MAG: restriction endonuclease subunit S [Candidatus Thorarchaeota archaeon]